ncbi:MULTISPECIES: VOC family protein [Brevibacterium]|uniref:VOC family protein n=1 Tax=Brevibacterium casei TaxID=33889 RepID=A0A7T3ZWS5_9MICO|nr:VOC family protein [Brevibacterium casei]QQB13091.1 VOC family protein [Brevibacterium casei]
MTSAPSTVLPPDAGMDAVTLRVGDLDLMTDYYRNALALEPLEEASRGREVHRVLGRGTTPMVKFVSTPDLPVGSRRSAGLFHTAFLFETPESLAATVAHAAANTRSRFLAAQDHLVSQAFYFSDPEGNGIELYVDRDRAQWGHSPAGEIEMDSIGFDPNAFLREHLDSGTLTSASELPGTVGHVHLQVGDLDAAREFYVGALGFEPTNSTMPGAVFASAGGYHHHVAMNTWNSLGAGPRAASLGLGDLAITVPAREDLDALVERLTARSLPFADEERSVRLADPWGTQVTVGVGGSTLEETLER